MAIEDKLVSVVILIVVVVGDGTGGLSVEGLNGYIAYMIRGWWCLVNEEGYWCWKALGIVGVCWRCRGKGRVKVWLEDVRFEVHVGWSDVVD